MAIDEDSKRILGWHFCNEDMLLGYGDGRKIVDGKTLSVKGTPVLCDHGLHASKKLIDALYFAQGSILCRVEVWGNLKVDNDKLVGTHRKCLWHLDISNLLHEFACRCTEDVLESAGIGDERWGYSSRMGHG